MKIKRAYKTELDPTKTQVGMFLQHAGCARWAYNWGLNKKIEAYKLTGKSPSAIDLHRELNVLKKTPVEQGGVPWMYESSKCAPQEALRNLDRAYQGFFRRCKASAKRKGFPKFKSRKNGVGSFRFSLGIKVSEGAVILPRIGKVRLKEKGYLPTEGVKVLSATISESARRWFVSIQVEETIPDRKPSVELTLGVDVGIKNLATLSDGRVFEKPKALAKAQGLLKVRQKALSRKAKGSNNRAKAKLLVAKLHQRIANIRKDSIHKMTSLIAKSSSKIVIEDLYVKGMYQSRYLAKALPDAAFGEILRQLKYKAIWNGVSLVVADRFFPSSKRCSRCGNIKPVLLLSERTYHCDQCGLEIDRDLNAAKNLAESSSVSACRPESSGLGPAGLDETIGWAGTLPVLSG